MSYTPRTDAENARRICLELIGKSGSEQEAILEREMALEHEQWRMTAERLESVERELAQAKEAHAAQQRNYLDLVTAVLGNGTFAGSPDPFKEAERNRKARTAGEALAKELRGVNPKFLPEKAALAQWEALKKETPKK